MKESTHVRCKCGSESVYRYGAFLQCSACMALYYEVDGRREELPDRYCPTSCSFPEMLDKVFVPVLESIPTKVLASLQTAKASEVYVPYLNVITPAKNDILIPASGINSTSFVLNGGEAPILEYADLRHQKISDKVGCAADKIADPDADSVSAIISDLDPIYISGEVFYVQLKSFSFQYNGTEYNYIAYGNNVSSTKGHISDLMEKPRKEGIVRRLLNIILMLGIIVCAAIVFCGSYVDTHGILPMFYWNTGYMCIFRFIGAALLGIMGVRLLFASIDNIMDASMMIRKDKLMKKAKSIFGKQNTAEE